MKKLVQTGLKHLFACKNEINGVTLGLSRIPAAYKTEVFVTLVHS